MSGGYELVFAFRDRSPSFAHGFTLGRIWQQMKGRDVFSQVVPAELREDVIALATTAGWDEQIVEMADGWISVGFSPAQSGGEQR